MVDSKNSEDTSEEHLSNTEIIKPQAVKDRVMQFFEGVDLTKVGDSKMGLLTVRTRNYDPEMVHRAMLNGFTVAEYNHIPTGIDLEPLPEGKDRDTAYYFIRGNIDGRGEIAIRHKEYERRPAETTIYIPPTAMSPEKKGTPQIISASDQKLAAEVLGIKV